MRDLVPFVQFKKREKHSWRSVNFSRVADKPDLVRDMDINMVNIKLKKKIIKIVNIKYFFLQWIFCRIKCKEAAINPSY